MGYSTCLYVANDALHEIENDPEFGRNVARAVRSQISSSKSLDIAASSSTGGVFANAAAVVGQAHADEPVLYFFQMNEGKRIGKDAPAAAIMQMRLILEANGWSVTKPKEKAKNGK